MSDNANKKSRQDAGNRKCRWGILSAAGIAQKVGPAIQSRPNAEIVAVASRSLEKAQQFAEQMDIPRAYGTYEELLNDNEVDAVYVPVPTAFKTKWAVAAAEKGKHVLVEKPFASAAELDKIILACLRNNVQFMDGTMWVHHTRREEIDRLLQAGSLGKISQVSSFLTFLNQNPTDIRKDRSLEPLGAIGDLGWYNTKVSLWLFNWDLPQRVYAQAKFTSDDAKTSVTSQAQCLLEYADDRSASFFCGFHHAMKQWMRAQSSSHMLAMEDFLLPWQAESLIFPNNEFNETAQYMIQEDTKYPGQVFDAPKCVQHNRMVQRFSDLALSNQVELNWSYEARVTQIVLDALEVSARQGKYVRIVCENPSDRSPNFTYSLQVEN